MRVKRSLAYPVKKSLSNWHSFFEGLDEDVVVWDIVDSDMSLYLAPMADELDLILIRAEIFVVYSMYRCLMMMGHY